MTATSATVQTIPPAQTRPWRPEPGWPPPPSWIESARDTEKLDLAAATLRRYGIAVATGAPGAAEEAVDLLTDRVRSRFPEADGACVVWTASDAARCVDPAGGLCHPLPVHTRGPGVTEAAVAAFGRAGLGVTPGDEPGVVLVHTPGDPRV